jgi:hypothetical protein
MQEFDLSRANLHAREIFKRFRVGEGVSLRAAIDSGDVAVDEHVLVFPVEHTSAGVAERAHAGARWHRSTPGCRRCPAGSGSGKGASDGSIR